MAIKDFLNKIFARKKKPSQIEAPRGVFSFTAGQVVDADSAMQVSAFYRGVMYISTQIAKLPWQIKNADNAIVQNNISQLLDVAPNPEMNAFTFRLCMVQNAIVYGNAFAEIERDLTGRPKALWPILSQEIELYRTPQGELVYRVVGGSGSGPDVYLPASDVFHVRNFHTKDGLVGQGVVAYGKQVLGIALGADSMASGLFSNGGLPSGVIEVKGVLSDEAYNRLKEDWKKSHGGKRSGGVAILEEEMKFTPVSFAPDVLQFLESRKFSVLEIARFLGVPPVKLFDIDANSYNTQEQSSLEVVTDTLDAWAKNLELEADIKLLSRRANGLRTEMNLYAVHRGDMETRASYFSKMMQMAAITPNEIRKAEGHAPYDGGDRFYVAVNNFSPADRIDEILDAQIRKSERQQERDVSQPSLVERRREDDTELDAELKKTVISFLKK